MTELVNIRLSDIDGLTQALIVRRKSNSLRKSYNPCDRKKLKRELQIQCSSYNMTSIVERFIAKIKKQIFLYMKIDCSVY
ncbi:hypothetical protein [Exiguobacterium sp. SH31]|uniref:hypothetical protein n=1 Tax=Exiguobacterium sp. SH31 TaxID=1843183 RepID=UPI00336C1606